MGFSYTLANTSTKALDFIRLLLHDVQSDRPLLQDEEIGAFLAQRGLLLTTDPIANSASCYDTASECARSIEAKFASEAETEITDLGIVKQSASVEYRRLANELAQKALAGVAPSFEDRPAAANADAVNPSGYDNDFVAGVDPIPGMT